MFGHHITFTYIVYFHYFKYMQIMIVATQKYIYTSKKKHAYKEATARSICSTPFNSFAKRTHSHILGVALEMQSATKLLTHSPSNPLFCHCDPFLALLACHLNPCHPQTMLCRNFCDLEEQTSNIELRSGAFSTIFCTIKRVVLFGALKIMCQLIMSPIVACNGYSCKWEYQWKNISVICIWKQFLH